MIDENVLTIINKDQGTCLLCSENRILERAHIIPKRFTKLLRLPEDEKLYVHNVFLMCPTHHRLFDLDRLNAEEYKLLEPCIRETINYLNHFVEHAYLDYEVLIPPTNISEQNCIEKLINNGKVGLDKMKQTIARYIEKKTKAYNL